MSGTSTVGSVGTMGGGAVAGTMEAGECGRGLIWVTGESVRGVSGTSSVHSEGGGVEVMEVTSWCDSEPWSEDDLRLWVGA